MLFFRLLSAHLSNQLCRFNRLHNSQYQFAMIFAINEEFSFKMVLRMPCMASPKNKSSQKYIKVTLTISDNWQYPNQMRHFKNDFFEFKIQNSIHKSLFSFASCWQRNKATCNTSCPMRISDYWLYFKAFVCKCASFVFEWTVSAGIPH